MKYFLRSSDMRLKASLALQSSLTALDAESSSIDAYNQGMHLKMASTIVLHVVRGIMNMGHFIFDFFNMICNIGKERSQSAVIDGLEAIFFHLAAALIDFVNVVVTFCVTLIRSVVSCINGYKPMPQDRSDEDSSAPKFGFLLRHTLPFFLDDIEVSSKYEDDSQRYEFAGHLHFHLDSPR